MSTHLRTSFVVITLAWLWACGPEEATQVPRPPAVQQAEVRWLAIDLDATEVLVTAKVNPQEPCPVLAPQTGVALNGFELTVQQRGSGAWVTGEQSTSGSALYPSLTAGVRTTLVCEAPLAELRLQLGAVVDSPLRLELRDEAGVRHFEYGVALADLQWRMVPSGDGALQLRWAGPTRPDATRAVVVRQLVPAGRYDSAFESPSLTELRLPQAAEWGAATVELTTSVQVGDATHGPPLHVSVKQVLTLP